MELTIADIEAVDRAVAELRLAAERARADHRMRYADELDELALALSGILTRYAIGPSARPP